MEVASRLGVCQCPQPVKRLPNLNANGKIVEENFRGGIDYELRELKH
jgi:hypothetical protein